MQIQSGSPLKQTISQLQEVIQPSEQNQYVDSIGQKVQVLSDTKFNVSVNKAGAVIPLMWDQASGEFKAVFKENNIPTGLSADDIEQAKQSFGEETSGNIVVNSDDVKINSNDTIVANSGRTVLGEECDHTAVINSPGTELHECEFGVIKDSPEFFGWLSHWLRVDKSRHGQVHNSDDVHMIKSPGAHVDSCEYLKMDNSPSSHFRQSSKTNVVSSSGAQGYEVNGSEIENSRGFTGAYSYQVNVKDSGGNGVIHSPLTKLIDSPYENAGSLEYYQHVQEIYADELNETQMPEDFHEASDLRDAAFKTAIEGALEEANILNAPESFIEKSPTATVLYSLKPTIKNSSNVINDTCDLGSIVASDGVQTKDCSSFEIDNSPNAQVIDSTGAVVKNSPGAILETSMGKEVIDEPDAHYVNEPANSGEQEADYKSYLDSALEA